MQLMSLNSRFWQIWHYLHNFIHISFSDDFIIIYIALFPIRLPIALVGHVYHMIRIKINTTFLIVISLLFYNDITHTITSLILSYQNENSNEMRF